MKNKKNNIKSLHLYSYLTLFTLSLFLISDHFANPPTPTLYLAVGGCCLLAILEIIIKHKQQILNLSVSEVLLGGFILFTLVYGACSESLNPEWIIGISSLGFFYFLVRRINLPIEWLFTGLVFIGIAQASYGLGQYMHWFSNIAASSFPMSGSFDNPAGFAATLSVCFPFGLFLLTKQGIYWKIIGGLSSILFIVAVALSHSRAGIIAIIIISGIWAVKVLHLKVVNNWRNLIKIVGGTVLIIALLVGLYYLKKDSADGRLLIWKCSVQMIMDKPLLGHGEGGFQRDYMLYQADYFRNHPVSRFAMLADIVKHPFNEYLLLLVEYGFVGGFMLAALIFLLIREYRLKKKSEKFYAMLCLVGIGVFACFSYPLNYPFVRLMAVFSAAFIMQNETIKWKIPQCIFSILKPTVLVVLVALLTLNGKMFYDDYRWNAIAQRSLAGETQKVLPDYARLYKTMNRNGLFLYNYGSELNYIGEWNKSNAILNECANFYNDIDLQLQLADNYTQLKQYRKAENCLLLAHQMIPNRFIPLYRLALLYKEEGKIREANRMAQIIIKKSVKIASGDVFTIKEEMAKLIQENRGN